MTDNPRIEELRRRVQTDPASIAFAQLAEEYRRSGNYDEAVRVCRTGLAKHPSYLSARVTLGRALIELEQYDDAQTELDYVLRSAPENLAAIRGLAEIYQRRGQLAEALRQYQTALGIAKHDPELEESVHELTRQLGGAVPAAAPPGGPGVRTDVSSRAEVRASEAPAVTPPPIPIPDIGTELGLPPRTQDSSAPETPLVLDTFRPVGEAPVSAPAASPALSPELEAAADEFTRALQALDALTIDVPPPPLAADALDLPLAKPAEDERLVPAEDWEFEGLDTAGQTPAAAQPAAALPTSAPEPDADALQDLESWLDNIVTDRPAPPKQP